MSDKPLKHAIMLKPHEHAVIVGKLREYGHLIEGSPRRYFPDVLRMSEDRIRRILGR